MTQRLAFLLCLFLIAITAPAAGFAQQNGGVALLIGNAAYPDAETPLKEPLSDAHALGDELSRQGFDTDVAENLSKEAMQRALEQFYGKIKSTSTAVIFFSGFGIQSDRQTYLIPVNAQIWNENDVRRDGFNLDKILAEMTNRGARVKIAILDASRRNPFERRFRSVSAGLAAVAVPKGTVVMSSAPPDTLVSEGNPVFMSELIRELKVSGATIEQIFNRTRMDVSRATKGQQVPWFSSSLEEDFSFGSRSQPAEVKKAETSSTVAPVQSGTATDKHAATDQDTEAPARHDYVSAEILGTRQGWEDFIKKYPNGYYHDLAHDQLAKLTPDTTVKPSHPEDAAPKDLAGYYKRGQHYAANGDFKKAIKDFDEVIRRDPKHAGALNDRCWSRTILGDLQDAMKDCDKALKIAPNYVDALDSRGLVDLKIGMLKEAIADYDAALQIDPKHASSLYGRGIAKRRSGNIDGGKSDVEAAKALQSTIADEFAGYGIK